MNEECEVRDVRRAKEKRSTAPVRENAQRSVCLRTTSLTTALLAGRCASVSRDDDEPVSEYH
jgi:hypothetical protein